MQTIHLGVYDTMADWEFGHATAHINNGYWHRRPGTARVVTVASSPEPVVSMGGLRVVPDCVLDDLTPAASSMLILPGAQAWLEGGLGAFAGKARDFVGAGVPVAAICGATVGLARAGVLDSRRHTSNAREVLTSTGYRGSELFEDSPVVVDGPLITASGIAPVEFAQAILAKLGLYDPAVLQAWYRLYGERDVDAYTELGAA